MTIEPRAVPHYSLGTGDHRLQLRNLIEVLPPDDAVAAERQNQEAAAAAAGAGGVAVNKRERQRA